VYRDVSVNSPADSSSVGLWRSVLDVVNAHPFATLALAAFALVMVLALARARALARQVTRGRRLRCPRPGRVVRCAFRCSAATGEIHGVEWCSGRAQVVDCDDSCASLHQIGIPLRLRGPKRRTPSGSKAID
jgi:hypothetical protein